MVCEYCKIEFSPKSSRARFCSVKCKTYAGREKKKIVSVSVSVAEQSGNLPVSVAKSTIEANPTDATDTIDEELQRYLEEYEALYLKKSYPKWMGRELWRKTKEKRLNELKFIIDGYEQKRKEV